MRLVPSRQSLLTPHRLCAEEGWAGEDGSDRPALAEISGAEGMLGNEVQSMCEGVASLHPLFSVCPEDWPWMLRFSSPCR